MVTQSSQNQGGWGTSASSPSSINFSLQVLIPLTTYKTILENVKTREFNGQAAPLPILGTFKQCTVTLLKLMHAMIYGMLVLGVLLSGGYPLIVSMV